MLENFTDTWEPLVSKILSFLTFSRPFPPKSSSVSTNSSLQVYYSRKTYSFSKLRRVPTILFNMNVAKDINYDCRNVVSPELFSIWRTSMRRLRFSFFRKGKIVKILLLISNFHILVCKTEKNSGETIFLE